VEFNGNTCRRPDELIQSLIEGGHKVEVCPRSTITTFGASICVKEDDGCWTNIPVGIQLMTGYERSSDGRAAYFTAPHGGLDIDIRGPLIGKNSRCSMQFYVAIDGLCAFHSNHDADAPWLEKMPLSEVYTSEQAVRAIRMAGLVGVVFNSIGTDMDLPFGGYGVLGVCNDSAALIDFALRGETNAYPLVSTGRYLGHIVHSMVNLKKKLQDNPHVEEHLVKDLECLIGAASNIDSDIHSSPIAVSSAARRYLATYPKAVFRLSGESRDILKEMAAIHEEHAEYQMW